MRPPYQKRILNEQERMRLRDCWHGFFDDEGTPFERVQRDVDYLRGFAQGVYFMRRHGHKITSSKFETLWDLLMEARVEAKSGRTCLPLCGWLEERFRLSRDGQDP
jgi:hypothetical protein